MQCFFSIAYLRRDRQDFVNNAMITFSIACTEHQARTSMLKAFYEAYDFAAHDLVLHIYTLPTQRILDWGKALHDPQGSIFVLQWLWIIVFYGTTTHDKPRCCTVVHANQQAVYDLANKNAMPDQPLGIIMVSPKILKAAQLHLRIQCANQL